MMWSMIFPFLIYLFFLSLIGLALYPEWGAIALIDGMITLMMLVITRSIRRVRTIEGWGTTYSSPFTLPEKAWDDEDDEDELAAVIKDLMENDPDLYKEMMTRG